MNKQVKWNDYTVTLVEDAYLDGTVDYPRYQARARDTDGREYLVVWRPCDNYEELDSDMACDWDRPDYIRHIGYYG